MDALFSENIMEDYHMISQDEHMISLPEPVYLVDIYFAYQLKQGDMIKDSWYTVSTSEV